MTKLRAVTAAFGAIAGVVALTAGAAVAGVTTVTGHVGPISVPAVPIEVCVQQTDVTPPVNHCVPGPAAHTVELNVVVTVQTPTPNVQLPTVSPGQCPAGTQGAALQVNTGGATVTIGGTVVLTVDLNGTPTTQVIQVPPTTVGGPLPQTLTVFACAGISPGLL